MVYGQNLEPKGFIVTDSEFLRLWQISARFPLGDDLLSDLWTQGQMSHRAVEKRSRAGIPGLKPHVFCLTLRWKRRSARLRRHSCSASRPTGWMNFTFSNEASYDTGPFRPTQDFGERCACQRQQPGFCAGALRRVLFIYC